MLIQLKNKLMKSKNISFLLFIVISLLACSSEYNKTKKNIIIKGSVTKGELNAIVIYTDSVFRIVPIQNNQFTVNLPLLKDDVFLGMAAMYSKNYIYAMAGDTLDLKIDATDFSQSLVNSLTDPINNYLLKKQISLSEIRPVHIEYADLDSIATVLNENYHSLLRSVPDISENFKYVEQSINIKTELLKLDYSNKLFTERESPLKEPIVYDEKHMVSPVYLDFMDNVRWGLASETLDSLINSENRTLGNYLLFRDLRSDIVLKGIGKIESKLNLFNKVNTVYDYRKCIEALIKERESIVAGAIAPNFTYENEAGEMVQLNQFKGKYVLIDLWATWCAPCIKEMVFLEVIQKKFEHDNIEFIMISIDEDKDRWLRYLSENSDLDGVQLIGNDGNNSTILKDYKIGSIPNYILIDPEGKIVDVSAPRPSSGKLEKLLIEKVRNKK